MRSSSRLVVRALACLLAAASVSACSYNQPGKWHEGMYSPGGIPAPVYDMRAMVANPHDLVMGRSDPYADSAAIAVHAITTMNQPMSNTGAAGMGGGYGGMNGIGGMGGAGAGIGSSAGGIGGSMASSGGAP